MSNASSSPQSLYISGIGPAGLTRSAVESSKNFDFVAHHVGAEGLAILAVGLVMVQNALHRHRRQARRQALTGQAEFMLASPPRSIR